MSQPEWMQKFKQIGQKGEEAVTTVDETGEVIKPEGGGEPAPTKAWEPPKSPVKQSTKPAWMLEKEAKFGKSPGGPLSGDTPISPNPSKEKPAWMLEKEKKFKSGAASSLFSKLDQPEGDEGDKEDATKPDNDDDDAAALFAKAGEEPAKTTDDDAAKTGDNDDDDAAALFAKAGEEPAKMTEDEASKTDDDDAAALFAKAGEEPAQAVPAHPALAGPEAPPADGGTCQGKAGAEGCRKGGG